MGERSRYGDGASATVREVDVAISTDAITLTGDGVSETWPIAAVRRVGRHSGAMILAHTERDGARLTLAPEAADAFARLHPELVSGAAGRRTAVRVTLALVVAAVVIAGGAFVALPLASYPLARAVPPEVERNLGRGTEAYINLFSEPCPTTPELEAAITRIGADLELVSETALPFRIELVNADFPNALALPGGRILVTDELIDIMEDPDEFVGVLAHEAAHVAKRHVMAALIREVGYGLAIDLTVGGGSGAGQQIALASAGLDSLRHSRIAEAEADELAVQYLGEAGYNPMGLALFFERLEIWFDTESDRSDLEDAVPELLSTHPRMSERAATTRALADPWPSGGSALTDVEWTLVKQACGDAADTFRLRDLLPGRGEG